MVGWHHQLDGHEFEKTPGDGDGQGSLVCFSPWGHKESNTTDLNWKDTPSICYGGEKDWALVKSRNVYQQETQRHKTTIQGPGPTSSDEFVVETQLFVRLMTQHF